MGISIGLDIFGSGYPSDDRRWMVFAEALARSGVEVRDGLTAGADVYLAVDYKRLPPWASQLPTASRLLLAVEPPVVNPKQYGKKAIATFGRRIALSPEHARLLKDRWHPSPSYLGSTSTSSVHIGSPHTAGMLNANKNSVVQGSLYKLRRGVIREAAARRLDFVLGGVDWTMGYRRAFRRDMRKLGAAIVSGAKVDIRNLDPIPLPTDLITHVGPVADKSDFFAQVQAVVTIENSATYVSEKLVEVIRHGRVPIYVGPQFAEYGIPESLVLRSDPTPLAVVQAIESLTESSASRILENGRVWLAGQTSVYAQSEYQGMQSLAALVLRDIAKS